MWNFFKKKEKEMLDTPKNLPELAKDMFESQSPESVAIQKVKSAESVIQELPKQVAPEDYKIPSVPTSSDVPRLDLNLIRSANIHLSPSDVQSKEEHVIRRSPIFPRESVHVVTLPKANIPEQRNIYIHKGPTLFDDLESAIANNNDDLAKNIIDNILPLLYEYHDIDSMNDFDRIKELKDLEKFWNMLQKRKYAVKNMIDFIESDILRKSNGLLNNTDTSMRTSSNQASSLSSLSLSSLSSSSLSSSSLSSSSLSSSSGFQPVFVPIIKNSSNNSNSNNSNLVDPVGSATPVYVQPYERFYFKDGKIASSLRDLYYVLNDISDDTFYHHVSIERNDFSNWVKDVLKEYSLAKEISTIYSRRDLIEFLKNKI